MKRFTSLLMILTLLLSSVLLIACDDTASTTKGEETTTAPVNGGTPSNDDNNTTTTENKTDNTTPPASTNPTYTITVVDQNGDPVEGVMVQFCVGTTCTSMFGKLSDAEGKIVITTMAENSAYQVAATVAPSEFDMTNEANKTKYTFDENNCLTITLTSTAE